MFSLSPFEAACALNAENAVGVNTETRKSNVNEKEQSEKNIFLPFITHLRTQAFLNRLAKLICLNTPGI